MDLQDVYCLMNSFCVCLSLIIQKHRTILICPLMEKCSECMISAFAWFTKILFQTLSELLYNIVP